jgi:hypothetical protein
MLLILHVSEGNYFANISGKYSDSSRINVIWLANERRVLATLSKYQLLYELVAISSEKYARGLPIAFCR